ncbi:putative cysteine-rich receptor-like protein kinase 35 [Camellia sinensis]|uniref:putative cysteine-rich receptor-like protein kinase 35 n=1 Tax=Camellia sinensis TaxID=4442 RepID=UPI001035E057|nr:putative cysteine-rich receptor-like protein kinase 35 [Camellia sinensis]
MVSTQPDIAHAVGVVSRFLSNPGKEHWEAVKWILRYLKGTTKMCLCFRNAKPVLEGYTDSDMVGDLDGRKSTSGFLFTFAGGAVSWQSKLQNYVALSTTEAEYITAAEAGKEMLWLQRFLQELGLKQEKFMVHCDSQSAIDLSKNSMYHSRTKHINIRYHWIREVMERQLLELIKIHTDKNPADILTKCLTVLTQGLREFSFKTLFSATEGFHAKNKLGKGGIAQVYRGKLTDGGEIAVKKPLVISEKGKELVMNEMKLLLGSAHHRNIEFASNGSLDYLLFNSETCRAGTLDWKRTYAIIIGVARGLLYLHERSHNVIIHCDIKPTNILIDENWVPKIADFGMANLFPQDQTHVNINEATGTLGYLAPENMDNGHVSPKADTYSFGVVVLELISSRKNWNSHNQSPNGQGLWDTANELCKEVKVSEFMDLKLIPSAILDQVQLYVKIGVLCTEFDLELRPTMDPAYSMLLENHSSSNTQVNEPMRDGSSSSSSTA